MKHDVIDKFPQKNNHKESAHIQYKESTKKVAILITDIVCSTNFIETRGDLTGQLVLEKHCETVSGMIHKFGGNVVNKVSGSITAYFLRPEDALKAAVNLHQKMYAEDQLRNISGQVHIRVSIHYGYGIIENDNVCGDAVEVTAKLASLVENDQIYISHDVYDSVCDLMFVQFESVHISRKKNIPELFRVYRVLWDETLRLEPIMTTILYIKPVWASVSKKFKEAWNTLFNMNSDEWINKVENWCVLSDNSIVLVMKDDASIIDVAFSISRYLKDNFHKEETTSFFPFYVVIDFGSYVRADEITLHNVNIPWESMETGNIYISQEAYTIFKKSNPLLPTFVENVNETELFLKLNMNNGKEEKKTPLFLYHDALIRGTDSPCYYCGSKRHSVDRCPSKTLAEITDSTNKAGYKSLEEINKIFSNYLITPDVPYEETGDELNNDFLLAHQTFFDLKRIFQLRFFRTIWDTEVQVWDSIRNRMCKGNRSGITWIAQDCIRVSDLQKAGLLLEDCMKEHPHDYKVYCAWGFLYIEKSEYFKAEQFFNTALTYAKTNPEKIFLNFLLFRIYELTENFVKASEKIQEILTIDPHCTEAIYIDILLQFRLGGRNEPLRRLLALIQDDRKYYLQALVDPDLKSYCHYINPYLIDIFNNVKDEAKRALRETEGELTRVKKIFGNDEDVVKKAEESLAIMNKLAITDSYFGYLDIISHSLSIMRTMIRSVGELKKEISESLLKYVQQIRKYMDFLTKYPSKKIASSLYEKLDVLQRTARDNWRRAGLNNTDELITAMKNKQSLFEELELIEKRMKKLMTIQLLRQFYSKFMKRNILLMTVITAAAFIVMPIVVFYVNLILLKLNMLPIYDIWVYQKMVMIIGFLCSVIISFLITFMDVSKKNFMVH